MSAFRNKEGHWLHEATTGTLPERITPSQINALADGN